MSRDPTRRWICVFKNGYCELRKESAAPPGPEGPGLRRALSRMIRVVVYNDEIPIFTGAVRPNCNDDFIVIDYGRYGGRLKVDVGQLIDVVEIDKEVDNSE